MNQEKLQQNRSSRFLKAIGLYAIGNLGSKLITFLMVPLYTYYVNTSDYGFYDICLTLIFFAIPFMTLQMRDGAFRFLVDVDDDKRRSIVITFAYRVLFVSTVVAIIVGSCIEVFASVQYLWLAILLLIVMSFYEVVVQITRGIGNTVSFVSAGIISSLGIGVFSVVFVVLLDMGIEGVFIANILARVVALAYIELKDRIIRRYLVAKPDYGTIRKEIIKYTLPLIPGLVFWWIIGSTDRLFIEHYLGLSANGVYAVAFRLVSVLQVLATIFYQAWQETALQQYESADRDKFFSDMFNNYLYVLSCVLIVFVFSLRMCYSWLVSAEFAVSVQYLYAMAVSVLLFALVAFMDMGYQCAKDTKRTLPAIILAAVVNLVSNFILIRHIGLWGVVATSIITYTVLLVYRIYDMRLYFKLRLYKRSIIPVALLLAGFALYCTTSTLVIDAVLVALVSVVFIVLMPQDIKAMLMSKIRKN